jgi:trimethylamine--corrinoid protein Co-methyltransferase
MRPNHILHQTPRFKLLSQSQLEEIHWSALEVLRRTGVDVLDEEARELLKRGGAKLDGVRARLPSPLVEWAIDAAPSRIVVCDRKGNPALYLEGTRGYYGTGSDTIYTIDCYTGKRREVVKADVASFAKVCDALPNIDFVMSMGIASDVPGNISDLHHFEAMVMNTTKPIVCTAWNVTNAEAIVEMAETVAGGSDALRENPFLVMYTEPISPLRLARDPTQKIIHMADKGLPVICGTGKVGGATCPITIAGALVQGTAEALAGVTVAQLKREGAPIIFGGERLHMDMSSGLSSYGAPEFVLSVACNAEIATYYQIPSWSYAGCSDAKVFDQQAAIEGTIMTIFAALSGGNLNHDVGYLDAGLTSSLELTVAMDELIGMVKRLIRGIELSEEMLAVDVIHRVGPGGQFLTEEHTYRHFKEDWFPKLFERGSYEVWRERGQKTLEQRANGKVREILEGHTPEPFPGPLKESLSKILRHAEPRVSETF